MKKRESVRVDAVGNGYLVRPDTLYEDAIRGQPFQGALVFDTVERLTDWLQMHFGYTPSERTVTRDELVPGPSSIVRP